MSESLPLSISVLFVDDQPLLLKTIERVIRRKAPDWKCRFAKSGSEALELMKEEASEIIVSDMRMPGMDGVGLLKSFMQLYPNTLRFILSGQSDSKSILDSVGVAHQFFNKPVEIADIIEAISMSRTLYRKIQDPELQNLISTVKSLPTPKTIYLRISSKLNDPNVNLGDIADIVREDASLSAKLLQMVNSAFFGRGSRVDSIHETVVTLGIQNIRSLVLMMGVTSDFADELTPAISVENYAKHSLEVAKLCRWLAQKSGLSMEDQESLFTAGLLHNVGKLVLISQYLGYYKANRIVENPYDPELIIEAEGITETSHSLVGAALLALWGLPARIVNAVAFHHEPDESVSSQCNFAMIVHVADALVNYRNAKKKPNSIFDSHYLNVSFIEELGMRESLERRMEEYETEKMAVL